jgi:hypothetical protein
VRRFYQLVEVDIATRQTDMLLWFSLRLSTPVVDNMLTWFDTLSGGRNHGAAAGTGAMPRRREPCYGAHLKKMERRISKKRRKSRAKSMLTDFPKLFFNMAFPLWISIKPAIELYTLFSHFVNQVQYKTIIK